jgi:3-polyprenyl-4-hydroxybenzoate decarboxylase
MTVVAISRVAGSPATCGANPSSANAATLSRIVMPCSVPAISAPYTDAGRCLLARFCATATVSNHLLAIAFSLPSL